MGVDTILQFAPESTPENAPSLTFKPVTGAAFLVPVAGRMELPRVRAWLPRMLNAAAVELGGDLPEIKNLIAQPNDAIQRTSLYAIILAAALMHAPPPPPPAPAEPLLGAALAAARAERAAVLAAAAADPNIWMTVDLYISLHAAGEAVDVSVAGEAIAAATALWPSPPGVVPVENVSFLCDTNFTLDGREVRRCKNRTFPLVVTTDVIVVVRLDFQVASALRRLASMGNGPRGQYPRCLILTMIHAVRAFPKTCMTITSALLTEPVQKQFWDPSKQRHAAGLWLDFVEYVVAMSKTNVALLAELIFPLVVQLPLARLMELVADGGAVVTTVPTFVSSLAQWFYQRPPSNASLDPATVSYLQTKFLPPLPPS